MRKIIQTLALTALISGEAQADEIQGSEVGISNISEQLCPFPSYSQQFLREDAIAVGTTMERVYASGEKDASTLKLLNLVGYSALVKRANEVLLNTSKLYDQKPVGSESELSCSDFLVYELSVDQSLGFVEQKRDYIHHLQPQEQPHLHINDTLAGLESCHIAFKQMYNQSRQAYVQECNVEQFVTEQGDSQ
jgi:hypothetical protein